MGPDDPRDEFELVRRAREGEDDAFRVLFSRYSGTLRARIGVRLSPLLRRKVSLADILQEAYLVAFRSLSAYEYRGEGSFGRWLGKIAENRARKAVDRYAGTAKRDPGREVSRGGRPDTRHFVGDGTTPSQAAMAGELAAAAARALARLSADHREVLRLVQEEELTFPEAARRLGRSPDAVRMLYGRALGKYAEVLEAEKGGRA